MEKFSKIMNVVFTCVACLCILEFLFIRGLFTGIIGCCVLGIIGLIQVVLSVKNKEYYKLILTVLLCISIFSGYYVIINF